MLEAKSEERPGEEPSLISGRVVRREKESNELRLSTKEGGFPRDCGKAHGKRKGMSR